MSWRTVKLGELVENFSVRAKDVGGAEGLDFYGVSNEDGIIKTKYAAEDKAEDYKIIEKGCFAYNPYRVNVGSIGLVSDDTRGLISPAYVIFKPKPKSIIPELLFKFLKSAEGLRQIIFFARGTVRQALRFEDLCNIEISIPDYSEQQGLYNKLINSQKSSNILDAELKNQLELLKKLRQQLLQDAVQGKLTNSSPPFKEEYPKGEVVEMKTHQEYPKGEVVKMKTHQEYPKGEVVENINNLPHLKTFRKELRNQLTPAEAKLWTLLKGKKLEGKKFRRQFSVANYILDFYCPEEHLAIELDGQGHFEATQAEYDLERDLFLNYCGVKVLRFENKWVWNNVEGLLEEVKRNFGWRNNYPSVLRTAPQKGEQLMGTQACSVQENQLIKSQGCSVQGEQLMGTQGCSVKGEQLMGTQACSVQGEQFETGQALLEKIKVEKQQLIAAGKLKKEKPLPPIKPEDIPFEIPENWVWCRLGEMFEIVRGSSPRPKGDPMYWSKETTPYHWITIADFTPYERNGILTDTKGFLTEAGSKKSRIVKNGDLLVACSGVGSVGRSIQTGINGFIYDGLLAIRNIENDTLKVLIQHFLKFKEDQIYSVASGANWLNINIEILSNYVFPLPPLAEQERIVQKLEELMQYCNELEESIKQSQEQNTKLLQQVLREALRPVSHHAGKELVGV